MAYLRFSRDKGGYENTFVLHADDEDGGGKPRILYWFRTPPNVKVGRIPLDEETIRAIEQRNPGVAFDWDRMLKTRPTPPTEVRPVARGRAGQRRGGRPEEARRRGRPRADTPQASFSDSEEIETEVPDVSVDEKLPEVAAAGAEGRGLGDIAFDEPAEEAIVHPRNHRDVDDGGDDRDDEQTAERWEPERPREAEEREHPVVALMGASTLARLRKRYAEVVQYADQVGDQRGIALLEARADRIDPDRWTTIEAAVAGIERFETEFQAVERELADLAAGAAAGEPGEDL